MENTIRYEYEYGINWIWFTDLKTNEEFRLHRFEDGRGAIKMRELLPQSRRKEHDS
jgi:hypothetical protein